MSMAVDKLQLAKSLSDAGMDRAQAEALSAGLAKSLKDSDVATKADIRLLQADIERLRAEVRGEGDGQRKDMRTESATIRGEIANSRNQTILAMVGIAGLAQATARFL